MLTHSGQNHIGNNAKRFLVFFASKNSQKQTYTFVLAHFFQHLVVYIYVCNVVIYRIVDWFELYMKEYAEIPMEK